MKARILLLRSLTDVKMPRRMDWRSTMPNQTRFVQEARPAAVCVDNITVGPFDLLEKCEELLVAMSRAANRVEVPCR
jgi:hypothetical protein